MDLGTSADTGSLPTRLSASRSLQQCSSTLLLQGGILDLFIHTNHYAALVCIYRWRPGRPGRLCLSEVGLLCAETGLWVKGF